MSKLIVEALLASLSHGYELYMYKKLLLLLFQCGIEGYIAWLGYNLWISITIYRIISPEFVKTLGHSKPKLLKFGQMMLQITLRSLECFLLGVYLGFTTPTVPSWAMVLHLNVFCEIGNNFSVFNNINSYYYYRLAICAYWPAICVYLPDTLPCNKKIHFALIHA